MATKLNPYLNYPGTAREAMTFYQSVLGGKLEIMTFEDAGAGEGLPDPKQVMHAHLETPAGFTLMASDLPPGMEHKPGENIAISLSGDDDAELRGYWDKFAAAGTVTMPLDKQMWGDVFGMCIDQFGIGWMVNISQPAG